MEETDESSDGMNNDSTSSHDIIVEDLDEEDAEVYERGSEKWYSITILILAVVGLAINITAVIIMRKKKGIFHTMLKVSAYDKNSVKQYLFASFVLYIFFEKNCCVVDIITHNQFENSTMYLINNK